MARLQSLVQKYRSIESLLKKVEEVVAATNGGMSRIWSATIFAATPGALLFYRKDDATTLAPRSWPSWPIFATKMRGRRPAKDANASLISRTSS